MIFSPADGPNPWTARAGLLVTLLLSAASAGCGQRVCIEWSVNEGVCLSSAETLKDHLGTCTNVTSVDGEGVREGDLCCYPVTKSGPLPSCNEETTSSGPPPPVTTGSGSLCGGQGFCGNFVNGGCSNCSTFNLCSKQWNVCQLSNGCANIVNCSANCSEGDLECQKQCEGPNPDGLDEYRALTQCVYCNECANDCFTLHSDVCLESPTGVGGAGGMSGMGGAGGMSGMGGAGGKGGAP